MDWIKVRINTSSEGIEPVCGCLYTLGLTGLEIEDGCEFLDFIQQKSTEWDYVEDSLVLEQSSKTGVIAYLSDNATGRETLSFVRDAMQRLKSEVGERYGDLEITCSTLNEEDWAENWKKYFKPIEIGRKVLILPEWETLEQPTDRTVFIVNPGMNFGTGSHYTTQLCIEAVEETVRHGQTVMADIGCGSGILSIIALQLGAKSAWAIDIDPNAVENAYSNARLNRVYDNYEVVSGDILSRPELVGGRKFDLITANIIADVIIPLSPRIPGMLNPGGVFVCSGIISQRSDEVASAIEAAGMKVVKILEREDWVAIVAQ